jgi:tetratricopeptide (TPR) repeat protein
MFSMGVTGEIIGMSWAIPIIHAVKLLVETLLAVEIAARIGAGVSSTLGPRAGSRLESLATGFLLGFPCLGVALLGLALTGLFYPIAIWVLPIALITASGRSCSPARSMVRDGLGEIGFPGWPVAILAAVVAGAMIFLLLLPDLQQDSYIYHFGATWQFSQVHRAIFDWVPFAFSLSLPVEMTYIYPIMLGDDRLAKWTVATCFLMAGAIWYSQLRTGLGEQLAWLGPVFALGSWNILTMVTESKNDIAASSFFVAGALLLLRGRRTTGYALLGASAGAKYVYGPLALAFALFFGRPLRQPGKLALLAIPVLPWLLKAWLGTGDPLYPYGFRWFPNPTWDERNNTAFLEYVRPLWPAGTMAPLGVPLAWARALWADTPAFLLLLPISFFFGANRKLILVCLATQLLTLPVFHLSRYFIPSNWLISLVLVPDVVRWLSPRRRLAVLALSLYAAARIFFFFEEKVNQIFWRDAVDPPIHALARRLSTYGDAVNWVRDSRAGRVISIGGLSTYRIPARVVYACGLGETPLAWKFARESRDPAEIRKKIRQTGSDHVVFNFVTANWVAMRYSSFPWDQRSLRLYIDFCKKYLAMKGQTTYSDNFNGGFVFYDVASSPFPRPPAEIWWAPGSESVYAPLETLIREGNAPGAVVGGFLQVQALMPDVGQAWNRTGRIFVMMEDYTNALKYLRKYGQAGMTDDSNLVDLAAAAVRGNELDMAEEALARALVAYPHSRDTVLLNQATLYIKKAVREMPRGRNPRAEALVDLGLAAAAGITDTRSVVDPGKKKVVYAFLLGLKAKLVMDRGGGAGQAGEIADRGLRMLETVDGETMGSDRGSLDISHAYLLATTAEARMAEGNRTEAVRLYAEAARLYPGDPRAATWRMKAGGSTGSPTGILPDSGRMPGSR